MLYRMMLVLVLLAAALVVPTPDASFATNPPETALTQAGYGVPAAADHCVDLYQHTNGGGLKRYYCDGHEIKIASLQSGWNDEISSLSVGRWRSLKVYSEANFTGACMYVNGSTSYDALSAIRIDWRKTWNDIISSYIINPSSTC